VVDIGAVRSPGLGRALQRAIQPLTARRIARQARDADMVLAVGGYHVPAPVLQALPRDKPIVGWVGDAFADDIGDLAKFYDLVGYTDSTFLTRHAALDLKPQALYLPHAVNPGEAASPIEPRDGRLLFVGAADSHRRAVVKGKDVVLRGPGWRGSGRISRAETMDLYRRHRAVLNIANQEHVVAGLNQRHFHPPLFGAAVVSDAQTDLELCFRPEDEVLVWRNEEDLARIAKDVMERPLEAARIAARAKARILAEHTFADRLKAVARALDIRGASR
jgi:spore maturation protein CgeB